MKRENLAELIENGIEGDFCFETSKKTGQTNIWFRYPNKEEVFEEGKQKRGEIGRVPVNQPEGVFEKPWKWNGNSESPTIRPSILIRNQSELLWHGYITNGELETLQFFSIPLQ